MADARYFQSPSPRPESTPSPATRGRVGEGANQTNASTLTIIELGDKENALRAGKNYRQLGALGVTPRKTIDTIIATRCIESDLPLLYSDRDFDPFVERLGLRSAMA